MRTFAALPLLALGACASSAASSRILFTIEDGPQAHHVRITDEDGTIVADVTELEHVYSARVTPSGTVLATICEDDGRPLGLAEVDREGAVLWRYEWPPERAGIAWLRASHALANGNVLVVGVRGFGDDGRYSGAVILEIDRSGAEIRSVTMGPTRYVGAIRPLADGVLVAGEGVFELSWSGAKRVIVPPSDETLCFDVLPLPDGRLVLGETAQRLVALAPDGTEEWSAWHEKPVFLQRLADGRILAGG